MSDIKRDADRFRALLFATYIEQGETGLSASPSHPWRAHLKDSVRGTEIMRETTVYGKTLTEMADNAVEWLTKETT